MPIQLGALEIFNDLPLETHPEETTVASYIIFCPIVPEAFSIPIVGEKFPVIVL